MIQDMDPLDYGRILAKYGPDLRAFSNTKESNPKIRLRMSKAKKLTPYQFYVKKRVKELADTNPTMPQTAKIQLISKEWREMSHMQRQDLIADIEKHNIIEYETFGSLDVKPVDIATKDIVL